MRANPILSAGLKIPRERSRPGSIPGSGTSEGATECVARFRILSATVFRNRSAARL